MTEERAGKESGKNERKKLKGKDLEIKETNKNV